MFDYFDLFIFKDIFIYIYKYLLIIIVSYSPRGCSMWDIINRKGLRLISIFSIN